MADYVRQLQRFNVGEDCPVFDGLFEFCQIYASGSIGKNQFRFFFSRPSLMAIRVLNQAARFV